MSELSIDKNCLKCQYVRMSDLQIVPKQKSILEAAWQVFATYGFRKTSMDDIAQTAGMSRPALYQYYRNKEDILRQLVQYFYDKAELGVAEALGQTGPVPDVLAAAFAAQDAGLVETMLSSPHGLEILDTSKSVAGDMIGIGENRLSALYADWLRRLESAGQAHLTGTPDEVANSITAAMKGIKSVTYDYPTYVTTAGQLAQLIGKGLTAS